MYYCLILINVNAEYYLTETFVVNYYSCYLCNEFKVVMLINVLFFFEL